jgi:hypothetical protein
VILRYRFGTNTALKKNIKIDISPDFYQLLQLADIVYNKSQSGINIRLIYTA